MNKHNELKFLKETKAGVPHVCNKCERAIPVGETYYSETLKDKFLQSLHRKKFCKECYEKFGNDLLNPLVARPQKRAQLNKGYEDTPLFQHATKKK